MPGFQVKEVAKLAKRRELYTGDLEYCDLVLSEKWTTCRWTKLVCQRHIDDLKNGHKRGLWFNEDKASHAIEFFSYLKLWKGKEHVGKEFVLAPHNQFFISSVMGWYKNDNTRRFRVAYKEEARKNSKSTVAGGLGAYFFIADGESGADIYTCAVTRDQARIVFDNIKNLTKTSIFADKISYFRGSMSIAETWSKCEPLSSDAKSLDGLDLCYASLDELHAHPNPEVHDKIMDGIGTKPSPLIFIPTTAGFDQLGVCYQRREYLTKILNGTIEDDSFFGVIYTLDMKKDWPDLEVDDDWEDEDLWVKADPALQGVSRSGKRYGIDKDGRPIPGYMAKLEDIRDKAAYAKENPAALNNFLTKRMNIWTQQFTRWIDLGVWDENFSHEVKPEDYKGRWCVGGIDLSSVSDLTVWVLAFPDEDDFGRVNFLARIWCPEARLYDRSNKYMDQYQSWERQGYLYTTEGDAIDYDFVRAQILKDVQQFKIDSIGVDRLFQGYEFCMKLNDEMGGDETDPKVVPMGMGYLSMAAPCKELESRLLKRKLNHGDNPVLRFCADNVSVSFDPAGNAKPNKATSQGKIDGIIGVLLCLDRLMRNKPTPKFALPISI